MVGQRIAEPDPQAHNRWDARGPPMLSSPTASSVLPRARIASAMISQGSGRWNWPSKALARIDQRDRAARARLRRAARRRGPGGPAAHSPPRRATAPPRPWCSMRAAKPSRRATPSASATSSSRMTVGRHRRRLSRCAREQRAEREQHQRRGPQRPGQRLDRRLVADPIAVALDQPACAPPRAARRPRSARGPWRACRRPSRHRCRRSTGPGRPGSAIPPSAPGPRLPGAGRAAGGRPIATGGSRWNRPARARQASSASASEQLSSRLLQRRAGSRAMSCGLDRADMLVRG